MPITGIVARRRVADLDAAVTFYEALTDCTAQRFAFGPTQLASVGPFLLFSADAELGDRLEGVVATIAVDDLAAEEKLLVSLGAEIVTPAAETPNGRRLVARHPDGGVFEYVGA